MKIRKVNQIRVLLHERLVEVELSKGLKIRGVSFGSDQMGNYFVCLARPELLAAGITGHGPCWNKVINSTKVTFIEGAQPVEIEEDNEQEEEV